MKNIGILHIETYVPKLYVDQKELEIYDDCIGKYTKGLGQFNMSICNDLEDINSICLTVVNNLMINYKVDPCKIGFLEVGTETLIDKSKSTKSVLMQLFDSCGNHDLEGVDVKNACFGGTAALFHAIDWLESSNCNDRLAIVVAADIAVYQDKCARCSGGAGAVAILLGPDAPLIFDLGSRVHYMSHEWDFYKPNMNSEYPFVNGGHSIDCYFLALKQCYTAYKEKMIRKGQLKEKALTMDNNTYFCCHAPFSKLVEKSFARLLIQDIKDNIDYVRESNMFDNQQLDLILLAKSITKEVEVNSLKLASQLFSKKVQQGLCISKNVGNTYTASLYVCLTSLLINNSISDLAGSHIVLFSYGSGLASCMFSLCTTSDTSKLSNFVTGLTRVNRLLEHRQKISPTRFLEILDERSCLNLTGCVTPKADIDTLFDNTYYLDKIDDQWRRYYRLNTKSSIHGHLEKD